MFASGMKITTSRCSVIHIDRAHISQSFYSDLVIFRVNNYTYLGIDFNKNLNIKAMARFWLLKGETCLNTFSSIISNIKVLLEFKVQLIISVLILTLLSDFKIFRINKVCVNLLKWVFNNNTKYVLKLSLFCHFCAYDEFNLFSFYVSAAFCRSRASRNGLTSDASPWARFSFFFAF
ncbi:hypothetical protein PAEPH01_1948 [Pancytospora epiphaga]|nr:hypothetical protein PAEPH01_1948 [Pancytospora epiphaga]